MKNSRHRLVSAAVLIVISNVVAVTATGGLVIVRAVTSAPISVQSGYDASERFCGTTGEIQYVALRKQVKIVASLTAEKPRRQYSVIWQNNKVRGYTIGVFSTNASGEVRPGSLTLFRAGEVRGVGVMIYYMIGSTVLGVERFMPCQ